MKLLHVVLFILSSLWACAGNMSKVDGEEVHSSMSLTVVDELGDPVTNAFARITFIRLHSRGGNQEYERMTDSRGCCSASGWSDGGITVHLWKEGHYRSKVRFDPRTAEVVESGWWRRTNYRLKRMIVLKRIAKPVETAYAFGLLKKIPVYGEWLGFDLEKRAWTPPYGLGIHEDVLLKFTQEIKDRQLDFRATMEVSFTNNPFAGVYAIPFDGDSELHGDYCAQTNAVYQSTLSYTFERHPGTAPGGNSLGHDKILVFRTRTKIDERGGLVDAHYGRIHGPWDFYGGMYLETLHFNPIGNDVRIEDSETVRRSRRSISQ